jgi:hypothetical protein
MQEHIPPRFPDGRHQDLNPRFYANLLLTPFSFSVILPVFDRTGIGFIVIQTDYIPSAHPGPE